MPISFLLRENLPIVVTRVEDETTQLENSRILQLGASTFIPGALLKDILKFSEAETALNPSSFASGLNPKSL